MFDKEDSFDKLLRKVSDWSNNVHKVINNTAQQSPSCHFI